MDQTPHEAMDGAKGGFFSREAVSGVPWMVLAKAVLFFVYFGVTILTVNGLGKEKYGVYSVVMNIASYLLVVCGLGMGATLMRYIPELAVRRNRFGLVHLLWKSAALQLAAVVVVALLLFGFAEPLQRLFKAGQVGPFRFYLMLACGLAALLLLKEFVGTVFTSVFKTRTVAILSVAHGLAWLAGLYVWLDLRPEVGTVFFVQMAAAGAVYLFGAVLLVRHVMELPWEGREFGIGKRRALSFSGTVMLSTVLRMVMFKYSEVFFLAAVGGTTLAGLYDLGYTLPYTVVTFIPLALMPLFTAAFAEAYVRDETCLPALVGSYYKLLIMVSLPVSVLGAFFSPEAYHVIYHGEMDEAGPIASAFCIVLALPLVSMPLSAAIKAREKVLDMVPMLLLQIVVNLVLDWLLIVRFRLGPWGGILAVAGTFALTIPFRMGVVRGIVGGIYFPIRFFLRNLATLVVLGGLFKWLAGAAGLFGCSPARAVNVLLLFGVGVAYFGLFVLLVRLLRLVRDEDVEQFRALGIARLNRLLRLLVR